MTQLRRTATTGLVALTVALAIAGCENDAATPSLRGDSARSASPNASVGTAATDLSAIACATKDPEGVGELTGVWAGDEGGKYYIRHIGDCVWWFGTELRDIEPGVAGQLGFANVAVGRVDGDRIEVEWADVPLGNILGGGGLTLVYDATNDQLSITEQRGDWQPFGATTFTRIQPDRSPDAGPSETPRP